MKIKSIVGAIIPTTTVFVFSPTYSLLMHEIMLEKDEIQRRKKCTAKEAYSFMLESKIQEIEKKKMEVDEIKKFRARMKARFMRVYLEEEKKLLKTLLD